MKLPNGWQEAKIQEIALVNSGQGAPQGEKWYNGDEVFVKAGDLNFLSEGKYVGEYCKRVSHEAIVRHKLRKYPRNSIVFPKSGMSVKTDNIALLKYDSYAVNHLAIVQVNSNNEDMAKYLYYLFKKAKLSKLSLNDAYPSIRLHDIKKFKIIIPPHHQLRKIVTILEKAEQLKQLRKEADKLTDDYVNSVFLEMFGDPKRNPMKWEYKTLPEVVIKDKNAIKRGPFGGSLKKEIFTKKGFLVYEQYHAINNDFSMARYFIDGNKYRELEKFKVVPGDLIISCSGVTLGRIAEIPKNALPGIINQALLKISLDHNKINSDYFQFLFRHKAIQNILFNVSRGSGQPNFPPISTIKRIKFMMPLINLQNKFASIVEEVETLKRFQEISKREINDLFNVLNRKAFRGELNC